MQVPPNLLYTKDHEWLRLEKKIAVIGITFYAQNELGDVVYVEIEKAHGLLRIGSAFGTIEAVKTVSDLFMPISGKILEVNESLEPHPELVNSDPYGEGWMIKVDIENPEELKELINADSYKENLPL